MAIRIAAVVAIAAGLFGCQDGFDLSGHSLEGYDTFGRRGGTLYTPDGLFTLEVEPGALPYEIELSVGVLDSCMSQEVICYEIEPRGLQLTSQATITVDIAALAEGHLPDDPDDGDAGPMKLSFFAAEATGWRQITESDTNADTLSLHIDALGPIAILAERDGPDRSL